MTITTLAIVAFASSLDLLIGEPRTALHPVAWFGRVVAVVDREWPVEGRIERVLGGLVALVLPLAAAGVVALLVVAAAHVHVAAPAVLAGGTLFLTTSLRSLLELTDEVVGASASDLDAARSSVRGLVGRDVSALSPAEVRSAAIESAAENLSDGYVATLVPFVLLAPLSLPVAAAAATWVKGVNTLDSMLGYPAKPIGTASARLDDAVMWLPARLTAVLLAIAAGRPRALLRARRWARAPPSPNAGWPMATLAVLLDRRLEKPGVYVLHPTADRPSVADGDRAVTLVGAGAALAVLVAATGAIVVDLLAWELVATAAAVGRVAAVSFDPMPSDGPILAASVGWMPVAAPTGTTGERTPDAAVGASVSVPGVARPIAEVWT